MNGDADDGDAARNHGNGRVEEERKPAAHAPNLALLGVGRVLPLGVSAILLAADAEALWRGDHRG